MLVNSLSTATCAAPTGALARPGLSQSVSSLALASGGIGRRRERLPWRAPFALHFLVRARPGATPPAPFRPIEGFRCWRPLLRPSPRHLRAPADRFPVSCWNACSSTCWPARRKALAAILEVPVNMRPAYRSPQVPHRHVPARLIPSNTCFRWVDARLLQVSAASSTAPFSRSGSKRWARRCRSGHRQTLPPSAHRLKAPAHRGLDA